MKLLYYASFVNKKNKAGVEKSPEVYKAFSALTTGFESDSRGNTPGIYTPLNFMSLLVACMVFRILWSSSSVMQQNK